MHDNGGRVRPRVLAPAGEPAPATVAALHFREPFEAALHNCGDFGFVKDRVAIEAFPAFRAFHIVADFLSVQVRPLLLDRLQIETHVSQDALRDDGRQEAVERLLGAAIRVIDEIRQRIDHRPSQRRRVPHFQS